MKTELKNKLEAILFLEADPIVISEVADKLKIDEKDCLEALESLDEDYKKRESALGLVLKGEKAQLIVSASLSEFVGKYFKKEQSEQLSPAMLEVLAIVAYKGPISKAEVEYIRGVNCGLILRKLTIKGLIEKKEGVENSKVFSYEPSLELLKKMGISRLKDLPEYDKLTKELGSKNNK